MVPLGTPMPDFALPDPSGTVHAAQSCAGPAGILVIFMCNHCPYVVHVAKALAELAHDHADSGIGIVAINSNDFLAYPDDSPDKMAAFSEQYGLPFPYLVDESQQVAAAFNAACTPDFFLYDSSLALVYRGQMDDSRPGSDVLVTGVDLRSAMAALVSGAPMCDDQVPSMGCNIKWKSSAE